MGRHYQQTEDVYGKFTIATRVDRELFDFLRARENETGASIAQQIRDLIIQEMYRGDLYV